MIKIMFEYFKTYLIYEINIITSTLKIKELIEIDSSSQNLYYCKLCFCILHLIIASLSFSGENAVKLLTFVTHILAVVVINYFEWPKIRQITFDFEILRKFFYEIVFFINMCIFLDLKAINQKKENYKKNQIENNNKDSIFNVDKENRNLGKKKDNKGNELLNEGENHKQKENKYLNKIEEKEKLLSIDKEKYNNLFKEKKEEIKQLKSEITKKEEKINELLNENNILKQYKNEYLNKIKEDEKILSKEKENKLLNEIEKYKEII